MPRRLSTQIISATLENLTYTLRKFPHSVAKYLRTIVLASLRLCETRRRPSRPILEIRSLLYSDIAMMAALFVPTPNYEQLLDEILRDVALAMMKVNKSMDILFLRSPMGEIREALPSWVAHLRDAWHEGRTTRFAMAQRTRSFQSSDFKVTTAANRNIFIIKGRVIGTVAALANGSLELHNNYIVPRLPSSMEYYGTAVEVVHSIWQTLCCDEYNETETKAYREQFARLWI
jgi:hypothetical protein